MIEYNMSARWYAAACMLQRKDAPFATIIEQLRQEAISKYAPMVKELDDAALLDQTLHLAGGDDYDGCLTDEGRVVYELLFDELRLRFLGPEDNE